MAIHTIRKAEGAASYEVLLLNEQGEQLGDAMRMPSLADASKMAGRLNGGCATELQRVAESLSPVMTLLVRILALAEVEAKRG